jgi:hypothetical protein
MCGATLVSERVVGLIVARHEHALGAVRTETLGQRVRALRMRFQWSPWHRCYMRMTRVDPMLLIELEPAGLVPNERRDGAQHVIWWAGPDRGKSTLDLCEALRAYEGKGVVHGESFYVNEYGVRVA